MAVTAHMLFMLSYQVDGTLRKLWRKKPDEYVVVMLASSFEQDKEKPVQEYACRRHYDSSLLKKNRSFEQRKQRLISVLREGRLFQTTTRISTEIL